ncbi:hypothetical protein CMUS01_09816 [Colletotrichum musicola]|uniref:6-methylsalicylate decarboxylase n=1 Tax=Colletotrichum musicola TaxID=2175873 RepID=A0A8H6N9L6_9PEZI|nr:hypothetical protein CMUS01_09816 [Colletotrichum musicola]
MATRRVDVHHHFVPDFYRQALESNGGDPSGWSVPDWSLEKDIAFNEEQNTTFTFLSITAPGAGILPIAEQPAFCRRANVYASEIRRAHPQNYGFFASIPSLLDPAAAHAEIAHALDELQADGVILYTRYGPGNHYLGHPDFRSTWALLNARAATVFVHPTHPVDTALVSPSLPQPMIDYPHETTRAAVDLITSGTVRSFPDVKVILSHAGGTLPYLAHRPAAMLPYLPSSTPAEGQSAKNVTEHFMEDARSFYFDTALSAGAHTLALLREFARPGHVLFGSDFPYAPEPAIVDMNERLEDYGARDEAFVRSICYGAAVRLFPRLVQVFSSAS